MSTATVYLTAKEREMWEALPENVQKEYDVQSENGSFADTQSLRNIRLGLAQFHSPILQKLKNDLAPSVEVLLGNYFSSLQQSSDDDVSELLFVIGPTGLSAAILALLQHDSTPETLRQCAHLTVLRRGLFESFSAA